MAHSSFKQKLIVGASYSALGMLIGTGIRLVSTLVLTRLLAPDLFGLMAVASTFSYAAAMLTDVGLRSAIIQHEAGDNIRHRQAVWTVIFWRGFVICGLLLLTAGGIWLLQRHGLLNAATTFGDPRFAEVIFWLAMTELIGGMGSIDVLVWERQLNFRRTFIYSTGKQVMATLVTILWSWIDPGVLALCSGGMAANLWVIVFSHSLAKTPARLVWKLDELLAIINHGRWLLLGAVLVFATSVFDRLFLAWGMDATQLGIYSIAATLGLLALEISQRIGNSVVFPAMSERSRAGQMELSKDYYRIRRSFEYLSLASGFLFIGCGQLIIDILYDPRYAGAGIVLQLFGLVCLMLAYDLSSETYLALGHTRFHSAVALARLCGLLPGLALAVPLLGIQGGVVGLIVSRLCGVALMTHFNRRLGMLSWRAELRYAGSAAAVMAGGLLLGHLLPRG
jgi:O-antigen/teichoic acid export membrane protein